MTRLWIKICGLSTHEAIEAAALAGADAVGFVFHEGSPRNVTIESASALQSYVPAGVERVAVFLHPSQDLVETVVAAIHQLTDAVADGDALDRRHVLLQPAAALRQRLRVTAHPADVTEHRHATHQVLVDAQFHLADDLQRRGQEHVERVVDGAFGRVLDRHDAEVGGARFHLVEDFLDRRQRQRPHRVAEILEHRLLRERALRPEVTDLERVLLGEARGHDLAEQPQDLFVPQRAALFLVALQRQTQHLRFAFWTVEIDGVAGLVLRDTDLLCQSGPLVDQRMQL